MRQFGFSLAVLPPKRFPGTRIHPATQANEILKTGLSQNLAEVLAVDQPALFIISAMFKP